ncbi:zinc c2h2 type family protein [Stylonychia lemnae]|uniref:Zinc c2h2 type family protein n=1 Tax=Stylonychia lemnae TaxID=5949 RepID=A0A078BAF0_STYLE|nr:zinc c2h2 type family protein [Stylonychia lemnae]|eukprot:CDW90513.1 zinc c2h2 type family protein [Stylonychia lemnae]
MRTQLTRNSTYQQDEPKSLEGPPKLNNQSDLTNEQFDSPTRVTQLNSGTQSSLISPDKPIILNGVEIDKKAVETVESQQSQAQQLSQTNTVDESIKCLGKRKAPEILIDNYEKYDANPALHKNVISPSAALASRIAQPLSMITMPYHPIILTNDARLDQLQLQQQLVQNDRILRPQLTPLNIHQELSLLNKPLNNISGIMRYDPAFKPQIGEMAGQKELNLKLQPLNQRFVLDNSNLQQQLQQLDSLKQQQQEQGSSTSSLPKLEYNENIDYFQLYSHIFKSNQHLLKQFQQHMQSRNEILIRVCSEKFKQESQTSKLDGSSIQMLNQKSQQSADSSQISLRSEESDIQNMTQTNEEQKQLKEDNSLDSNKKLLAKPTKQSIQQQQQQQPIYYTQPQGLQPSGIRQGISAGGSSRDLYSKQQQQSVLQTQPLLGNKQQSTNNMSNNFSVQSQSAEFERYQSGRKKHFRRCANEIDKSYICPYNGCDKYYGSEGSLNLHMKLKHNAGSKTEREKVAKQLAWALQNGLQGAQLLELEGLQNINLPPGSIERAAQNLGIDLQSIPLTQQSIAQQQLIKQKLEAFVAGSGKLKNPQNDNDLLLADIQTKNMRSMGLPSPANALQTIKIPQPQANLDMKTTDKQDFLTTNTIHSQKDQQTLLGKIRKMDSSSNLITVKPSIKVSITQQQLPTHNSK